MDKENDKLTAEILFTLDGKIMALTHICSTLVALNPNKAFISEMLQRISEFAEKEHEGLPTKEAYVSGVQEVVDMLLSSAHLAAHAELLRDLKSDEGAH